MKMSDDSANAELPLAYSTGGLDEFEQAQSPTGPPLGVVDPPTGSRRRRGGRSAKAKIIIGTSP